MFKNEGGGVNGCLNNVQKNCGFGDGGHPLHLYLLDQVGGVLFWIRTLLHDSIKQLAPRHSLEKTRISFLQQNL